MKELAAQGVVYKKIDQLNVYWYDLTRPELLWHSFSNINEISGEDEAVYIYKNINPAEVDARNLMTLIKEEKGLLPLKR